MKKIPCLFITIVCSSFLLVAQDDTPDLDSATAVGFTWAS